MPAGFERVELAGKLGSMRTPETHAHEVAAALGPREAISRPLGQAQEMVLAADVYAAFPSPRFSNSQMDGYALPATAAGSYEVGPTIAAGADPDAVSRIRGPIGLPIGASTPAEIGVSILAEIIGERRKSRSAPV